MIIVEGPDGAGKTTLVERLCEQFGLDVGERATSDRDKLYEVTRQDTYTALSDELSGREPAYVWDRLYFSELVYYSVVGRKCEFSTEEQQFIERQLALFRCPVIWCMPKLDVVLNNVAAEKHQMKGVRENIEKIWAEYRAISQVYAARDSRTVSTCFDYTGELDRYEGETSHRYSSYDQLGFIVEGWLEHREMRQW